jgi:hypothetical protein
VAVRLVRYGTWMYVRYVLVRFSTSGCRVGFFDMKLYPYIAEGNSDNSEPAKLRGHHVPGLIFDSKHFIGYLYV